MYNVFLTFRSISTGKIWYMYAALIQNLKAVKEWIESQPMIQDYWHIH